MPDLSWQASVLAWLATYAVHSTVLLGSAALIVRAFPRASDAVREWIWKTALFGGLLTASAQISLVEEPVFGHLASLEQVAPVSPAPVTPAPDFVVEMPAAVADLEPVTVEPVTVEQKAIDAGYFAAFELSDWLLLALAACAFLGLGLDVFARFRLSYQLQGRRPVSAGPMPVMLTELGILASYPRAIRLTSSSRIKSPIAFGALWPEICVPTRALSELSTEQAQAMLAHELAHICRNDPIWLRLGGVLQCLFPWQLLFRVANRDLQTIVELRCDTQAAQWIGGGVPVAQCLVEVASWLTGHRGLAVAGLPAMAVRGSALKLRVDRLLAGSTQRGLGWHSLWLTPGLLSLLATVAAVAPGAQLAPSPVPVADAAHRDVVEVDRSVLRDVINELLRLLDQERAQLGAEVDGLKAELEGVELSPEMDQMLALLRGKLTGLDARRDRFNTLVTGLLEAGVASETDTNTKMDPKGENR